MKVPRNWDDLVAKCREQDKQLKQRYHEGKSWYDIVSENLGFYDRLSRKQSSDPWDQAVRDEVLKARRRP